LTSWVDGRRAAARVRAPWAFLKEIVPAQNPA
jgi:hypothetical protein